MSTEISQLRILVVDDEPLIRWSLAETFTERGCEVVQAGDAETTIGTVSKTAEPFDVVLLDLRLPDSKDLNLLAQLRRLAPRARIILMTAFGTPDVIQRALDLGAYQVISKPFEITHVAELVARASAVM